MKQTSYSELEFGPCGVVKATRVIFKKTDDAVIELVFKQKTYTPENRPADDNDLLKI
jgi:hypothetical protein